MTGNDSRCNPLGNLAGCVVSVSTSRHWLGTHPTQKPTFTREGNVSKSINVLAVGITLLAAVPMAGQPRADSPGKTHVLKATPKTVVWGYYDSASKQVLKIKSGDTVEVQTI